MIFLLSFSPANAERNLSFASVPLKIAFPVPDSVLLSFYISPNGGNDEDLQIYLLKPKGREYDRLYVGTVEFDGAPPQIESIFLHEVDGKPGGELFILVSWESNHPGGGISARHYATRIFSREADGNRGLIRLNDIEKKIGEGMDGYVEGDNGKPQRVISPYKNATDVRKILKKLGY
jgi:hypothetical protein